MLGEMLNTNFKSLVEQSRFLFVPGPADPGSANIFPRYVCIVTLDFDHWHF